MWWKRKNSPKSLIQANCENRQNTSGYIRAKTSQISIGTCTCILFFSVMKHKHHQRENLMKENFSSKHFQSAPFSNFLVQTSVIIICWHPHCVTEPEAWMFTCVYWSSQPPEDPSTRTISPPVPAIRSKTQPPVSSFFHPSLMFSWILCMIFLIQYGVAVAPL